MTVSAYLRWCRHFLAILFLKHLVCLSSQLLSFMAWLTALDACFCWSIWELKSRVWSPQNICLLSQGNRCISTRQVTRAWEKADTTQTFLGIQVFLARIPVQGERGGCRSAFAWGQLESHSQHHPSSAHQKGGLRAQSAGKVGNTVSNRHWHGNAIAWQGSNNCHRPLRTASIVECGCFTLLQSRLISVTLTGWCSCMAQRLDN